MAADPMSGTFEIEVTLAKPYPFLKSGFVASVTIYPATKQWAWLVPVEALVEGEKRHGYVFTVKDNFAHKTPVEILHMLGSTLALSADFSEQTRVVTEGAPYVSDNTLIAIQ